jgi:Family of unknown function (DUF6090)
MSEQNKSSITTILLKYLSEIVIIFLGISMSFWFDEWREKRKDQEMEQKILHGLKDNLIRDTMMLSQMQLHADSFINCSTKLLALKPEKNVEDSLDIYLKTAATYMSFNATETTYEEIKQTGRTSLIQNDTLRKGIIQHYTVYLGLCNEWCAADKANTETQLMPEMLNHFSIVADTISPIPKAQKLKALKSRKFRNLLLANITYKQGVLRVVGYTLDNSKKNIRRINKVLNK